MSRKSFFATLSATCLSIALILSSTSYVAAKETQGVGQPVGSVSAGDSVSDGDDATVSGGNAGGGTVSGGDAGGGTVSGGDAGGGTVSGGDAGGGTVSGGDAGTGDGTVSGGDLGNNISDAIVNADSAAEALDTIVSTIEISKLQEAMQTDAEVLELVKELEDAYIAEQGITVSTTVSTDASQYVDVENITVVGAGLNADSGDVKLEIAVPEKKENVSDQDYAKAIQLDIKLTLDGVEIVDLKMPVTISLQVPEGLDVNKLVILHFGEDGTYENVSFRAEGNIVTFTVTHFSTFVFAEKAGESDTNGSDTDNSTSGSTPATSTVVKVTSPKTGDSSNKVVRNLLLAAGFFGVLAALPRKKEEF